MKKSSVVVDIVGAIKRTCCFLKAFVVGMVERYHKKHIPIWPLCPVIDKQAYGKYCDTLRWVLNHKAVHNIAITGRYGSGKSSFLKTFFATYKKLFVRPKVLWVTLGKLGEYLKEPIDEEIIERTILQQILYSSSPTTLPFTRLPRIHMPSFRTYLAVCGFVLLSFLCWCCLSGKTFLRECPLFAFLYSIDDYLWLAIFFCLSLIAIIRVVRIYYKMSWSFNMRFRGIDIKLDAGTSIAPLDRFLDELLYFFQANKVSFVIFEDIDRFNRPHLFAKLCELNHTLNQSRQISCFRKPIRFLYAIKESLICEPEERVKYFDYILPIVPMCTAFNSREHLIAHISCLLGCRNLTTDYQTIIRAVSPYISDMRLLKNICNDFAIVRERLTEKSKGLSQAKLFGMIVFKNLLPKDFEDVQKGFGLMRKVLSLKREIIARQIKINQERIKECVRENGEATSVVISDHSRASVAAVKDENRKAARDIQSIKRKALQSLVERNELTVSDLQTALNTERYKYSEDQLAFIHVLIGTGCLGEDYACYVTLFTEGRLSQSDRDFELSVFRQKPLPFDYGIDNAREVIADIDDRYFAQFAMLNIDIVEYLISHADEYKRQLNQLRNQFFNMADDKFEFIDAFIKTTDRGIGCQFLLWLLSAQRNYVGLLCGNASISSASKRQQYAMILRNCLGKSEKRLEVPNALLGLLATDRDLNTILARYEIDEKEFTRLIVQAGLKFRNPKIAKDSSPLAKIVYDRGAFCFDVSKWRKLKRH